MIEPACRRMEWLDPFYKEIWEKAFEDAIPISGTFEITPRCNFDCRMCYVHLKGDQIADKGRELTAKEWIKIAEEAKDAGTLWLCITGGEPLVYPEFEVLWKELSNMGFFITLQTNASLIPRYKELFEQYPPRNAKITLYGTNDEIYKKVCLVDNGFQKTNEGIIILQRLKIPIQLVSTIIRQNEEDIQKMAFYAYMHNLPWKVTKNVRSLGRENGNDASDVKLQEYVDEANVRGIRYHMEKSPIDINRKPCTYCKDYRLGYWITWNGDMRFCSFMKEPNIPVKSMGFQKAWHCLIDYEEKLDWPIECKTCEANKVCFKCAGTLAAECGGPTQVTASFCNKIKNHYNNLKGE